MSKLNNSNCEEKKTQKLKLLKTQNNLKNQVVTKLKISNCGKT